MRVDGRTVLMLAGSNYLDLAGDRRVLAAAASALEEFGAAAGGSRLISGNSSLHETLERELADFVGSESALCFSTGYMANQGVLTALARPGDLIVSDALNHASIIDACRLAGAETRVFRHADVEDFARIAAGSAGYGRRILIVDGVYSMDGDTAPLADLVPIARAHDMIVIVDDAHGVGVVGPHGRGVAAEAEVAVDIVIGNLGKAFGSFGAFVACSRDAREFLINTARSFIFTCALAPACVGAARAALAVLREEPERRRDLAARADQLRAGLARAGYDTGPGHTHVVPAIVGSNERAMRLAERGLEAGVYAQGIRYPSVPRDGARLRFTPMSSHTSAEIEWVVATFGELRAREVGARA